MSDLNRNENELDMDIDIKALFEKDFDAEGICVSEDLIARTMAAIRKENVPETSEAESTVENAEITDITKRKRTIRLVSGIAAALFIGVVGFAIFRMGGGLKSERANDNSLKSAMANNIQADSVEEANSYTPEMYKDSDYSDVTESVKQESKYDAAGSDNSNTRGNYYDSTPNPDEKIAAESAYSDDSDMKTSENGASYGIINNITETIEEENTDGITSDILGGITFEFKQNTFSVDHNDILSDIKAINSIKAYSDLTSDETNKEQIKEEIIKAFTENGENLSDDEAYNMALILCDITGVNFCDENGTPVWHTGKEYWKLYSEAVNSEKKE